MYIIQFTADRRKFNSISSLLENYTIINSILNCITKIVFSIIIICFIKLHKNTVNFTNTVKKKFPPIKLFQTLCKDATQFINKAQLDIHYHVPICWTTTLPICCTNMLNISVVLVIIICYTTTAQQIV